MNPITSGHSFAINELSMRNCSRNKNSMTALGFIFVGE